MLNNASASTTQRFSLSLPHGTRLVRLADGGYELVKGTSGKGEGIGTIDAPWAKDARGKHVPTSYALRGHQLVQTIRTNSKTAFPVVADPKVSFGKAVYVRWNKSEVHGVAGKIAAGVSVGDFLCDQIPNSTASGFCKAVAGATLLHLGTVFTKASHQNKCVEVKWFYSPVYKSKIYSC